MSRLDGGWGRIGPKDNDLDHLAKFQRACAAGYREHRQIQIAIIRVYKMYCEKEKV